MDSARWLRMKRWPGWLALGLVIVGLFVIGVAVDTTARTETERVEQISKRLACPICDGESVFESHNNASESIRNEIAAQVAAGQRTDDEIISFFVQRDSKLLLVPRASGFDALVWILPVVAFVCATAGLVVAFRRWKRAADVVPTDDDRALVAAALSTADEGGLADGDRS
jgi:cytochrome c-type biogenesis protein CcmH